MKSLGLAPLAEDLRALWRARHAVLVVHAIKVLLSVPAAFLVGRLVHRELAHSLEAERFTAALEPALLMELLRSVTPSLNVGLWVLIAGLPLAMLTRIFFEGALLRTFGGESEGHPNSPLLVEGGRAFPRLLQLLPFGLSGTLIFGLAPAYGLHRLGLWLSETMRDELHVFGLRLVCFLIGTALFAHARSASGLARAGAAQGARLWASLALFLRALVAPRLATFAVAPWLILFAGSTLALSLIDVRIGRTKSELIVLGLVIQQTAGALRTLFSAAELARLARLESSLSARN